MASGIETGDDKDRITPTNKTVNDEIDGNASLRNACSAATSQPSQTLPVASAHKLPLRKRVQFAAARAYDQVPGLRRLPVKAASAIGILVLVNCAVWVVAAVVLRFYGRLSGATILAWTLGLRHALDADHISAIDLMTRRLLALNRHSVLVGTFFSLGHSTVILVTCIAVAATSAAISEKFSRFSYVGGIVGNSVSAAFLLLLGAANAWVLFRLVQQMRALLTREAVRRRGHDSGTELYRGGCMYIILSKMFGFVDRPWKMYPLGVLFGLGFDTSSQVALLGISTLESEHGTSLWLVLLLPVVFAAGMCLLDTADGALMYALYAGAMGLSSDKSDSEKYSECVAQQSAMVEAETDKDAHEHDCDAQRVDSVEKQIKIGPRKCDGIVKHITSTTIETEKQPQKRSECVTLQNLDTKPTHDIADPATTTSRSYGNLPTTLYYSVILTGLTVLIAVIIGVIQLLTLIQSVSNADGAFWQGIISANDHYDIIGAAICGAFIVAAFGAVAFHGRWIRLVERRQSERVGESV